VLNQFGDHFSIRAAHDAMSGALFSGDLGDFSSAWASAQTPAEQAAARTAIGGDIADRVQSGRILPGQLAATDAQSRLAAVFGPQAAQTMAVEADRNLAGRYSPYAGGGPNAPSAAATPPLTAMTPIGSGQLQNFDPGITLNDRPEDRSNASVDGAPDGAQDGDRQPWMPPDGYGLIQASSKQPAIPASQIAPYPSRPARGILEPPQQTSGGRSLEDFDGAASGVSAFNEYSSIFGDIHEAGINAAANRLLSDRQKNYTTTKVMLPTTPTLQVGWPPIVGGSTTVDMHQFNDPQNTTFVRMATYWDPNPSGVNVEIRTVNGKTQWTNDGINWSAPQARSAASLLGAIGAIKPPPNVLAP
jgi:hypothetical protein